MRTVLLATDADWIADEVDAALADDTTTVIRVHDGYSVADAVVDHDPELVILDLQIGNMGGMACCMHIRHEENAGRIDATTVMMLLDREADVFLARRSGADGWMIKPLDGFRIRRAAKALLDGAGHQENPTAVTVPAVAAE